MSQSLYHRALYLNIIKFVIGAILMTVNMVYASSKPIELTTLASSIGVLSQKI
jgi:uncharacterized membrane protein